MVYSYCEINSQRKFSCTMLLPRSALEMYVFVRSGAAQRSALLSVFLTSPFCNSLGLAAQRQLKVDRVGAKPYGT